MNERPWNVREKLEENNDTVDIYWLLGRPCFDPDLLSVAKTLAFAIREVHPFQQHPTLAPAAIRLQMALARAADTLRDPNRLQAYQRKLIIELRRHFAEAHEQNRTRVSDCRQWLCDVAHVHPEQADLVARAILDDDIDRCIAQLNPQPGRQNSKTARHVDARDEAETVPDIEIFSFENMSDPQSLLPQPLPFDQGVVPLMLDQNPDDGLGFSEFVPQTISVRISHPRHTQAATVSTLLKLLCCLTAAIVVFFGGLLLYAMASGAKLHLPWTRDDSLPAD